MSMPTTRNHLDIYEQQIFDKLQEWRANRARDEKKIAYWVCQNRTLCDLIRRKKDNPEWASGDDEKLKTDAIECWGFGEKKLEEGHDGYDMIKFMNENSDIQSLLMQSRENVRISE